MADETPRPVRVVALALYIGGFLGLLDYLGWEVMVFLALIALGRIMWSIKIGPRGPYLD